MYQDSTEEFSIRRIHSINLTCPENVSSFPINVKIFWRNSLSASSMPGKRSFCTGQGEASPTSGAIEFNESGSTGVAVDDSEFTGRTTLESFGAFNLMAFSLESRTNFLTRDRWLLKKSRTFKYIKCKEVRGYILISVIKDKGKLFYLSISIDCQYKSLFHFQQAWEDYIICVSAQKSWTSWRVQTSGVQWEFN